jgi:hypothetical protein
MKKRPFLFLSIISLLLLIACQKEEYLLCPDNTTKVLDLNNCPIPTINCPKSCDDNNNCTIDRCNAETNYTCTHSEKVPCEGNDICEEGEFPWSDDCPDSCKDNDTCTEDTYDYQNKICLHMPITPCCGNKECDTGETFVNCPHDCTQRLDIKVTNYQKRTNMPDAFAGNLMGTDYVYLIVSFKIHNIDIDDEEELNYKKKKGFYYDPYKMRLEDENGGLYDVEYDSDLVEDYLDYDIIEKGHTKGAALLFIVPMSVKNARLIAYDKYGSKLDIDEVY